MAKHLITYLAGAVLAGISLLPVLVAAWFCISQAIIYRQMETALEDELLETITLKTADLIWLKAGKEVLLGNKPFDVKKMYSRGDKSIITGLYDYQEKALKEKLVKLENNTGQETNFIKITRQVTWFAPESVNNFDIRFAFVIDKANIFCFKELFRQHDYSLLFVPPPRTLLTALG